MDALVSLPTLALTDDFGVAQIAGLCCGGAFTLIIVGAVIAGMWKVFEKAGQPGWAALVPIYNLWILTMEIAKKEIMWFAFFFLPCLNLVAAVMVGMAVAEKFGKSSVYGIGLGLVPAVFYPLLGFSDATYGGGAPAGGGAAGGGQFSV